MSLRRGLHSASQTAAIMEFRESRVPFKPGLRSSVSGLRATVFGATGYLGQRVTNFLARVGSQVITPFRLDGMKARELKPSGDLGQVVPVPFDLYDQDSIRKAIAGSNVVINLVGRRDQNRRNNFEYTHVNAAAFIAKCAREEGVQTLVHVSALGAAYANETKSQFFKSKAQGEIEVRRQFPGAVIFRPAPLWGEQDVWCWDFHHYVLRYIPFLYVPVTHADVPVEPVMVDDVARAIVAAVQEPDTAGKTYACVGPEQWTLRTLAERMAWEASWVREVIGLPELPRQMYMPFHYERIQQRKHPLVFDSQHAHLHFNMLDIPERQHLSRHLPQLLWRHRGLEPRDYGILAKTASSYDSAKRE